MFLLHVLHTKVKRFVRFRAFPVYLRTRRRVTAEHPVHAWSFTSLVELLLFLERGSKKWDEKERSEPNFTRR